MYAFVHEIFSIIIIVCDRKTIFSIQFLGHRPGTAGYYRDIRGRDVAHTLTKK